jgi:hypothetical protein
MSEDKTTQRQAAEAIAKRLARSERTVRVSGPAEVTVLLRSHDIGVSLHDATPFTISEVHPLNNDLFETRVILRSGADWDDADWEGTDE